MIWFVCASAIAGFALMAFLSRSGKAKALALAALGLSLGGSWLLLVFSLADLSAHFDSSTWPSPMFLGLLALVIFTVAACGSLVRKTD